MNVKTLSANCCWCVLKGMTWLELLHLFDCSWNSVRAEKINNRLLVQKGMFILLLTLSIDDPGSMTHAFGLRSIYLGRVSRQNLCKVHILHLMQTHVAEMCQTSTIFEYTSTKYQCMGGPKFQNGAKKMNDMPNEKVCTICTPQHRKTNRLVCALLRQTQY